MTVTLTLATWLLLALTFHAMGITVVCATRATMEMAPVAVSIEDRLAPHNFIILSVSVAIGDDPHFSIVLPSGKLLCYTVQGEHNSIFNLISNNKVCMNAKFVPDARREEVTWIGSMGIVVRNSAYKDSNATKLRFEVEGKRIFVDDKVVLKAKNVEKLVFSNGKLTISETEGNSQVFKYPAVFIDLQDVGLTLTIKFTNQHLDLFWNNVGIQNVNSHGLIGKH